MHLLDGIMNIETLYRYLHKWRNEIFYSNFNVILALWALIDTIHDISLVDNDQDFGSHFST